MRLPAVLLASLLSLPAQGDSRLPDPDDDDPYYDPWTVEERAWNDHRRPPEYSPAPRYSDTADCDAAFERYRESIDCFARFRNQNGSVRAEAYRYCSPVLDPSPRCGPPRRW
ncbi:MAG TPA: hypothetical protein VGO02_06655 [Burkholderiales bacterium]|jgi:hypothetical protein|nr:hypothetical protein [Burkholderiales bacterium]